MDQPGNIQDDIRLMNRLRNTHPALQEFTNLAFHEVDNPSAVLLQEERKPEGFHIVPRQS
jgi:starch synthase (maltosyl-transferring)